MVLHPNPFRPEQTHNSPSYQSLDPNFVTFYVWQKWLFLATPLSRHKIGRPQNSRKNVIDKVPHFQQRDSTCAKSHTASSLWWGVTAGTM